jgi:hypothetical protein
VAGNLFARATGTGRMEAKVWLTKTSKNETSPNGVIVIPKGSTLLASGKQDGLAFDLQAPSAFKVTLTPTPESDYIPYQSGQNLWLSLEMFNDMDGPTFSCSGSADSPGIGTDGLKMSLPLEEYQDRLEGVSEAASILDLKALGPVEKLARPGTLMTYSFTLSNAGFSADDFVTEATGPDASIATVVPGGTIHLDAKGSVQVTLGVKVPEKAVDNQAYEVVLFVHSKSDPTKSVVARTKTIAALHGDATADETRLLKAAQDDAKKTPGLEALGVLALVGIVAYARRR